MLANFGFANTARRRIFREFLRENELLSKSILACLSGAQMASSHEIKNAKNLVTLPFKKINYRHPINKFAWTRIRENGMDLTMIRILNPVEKNVHYILV